MGTAADEWDVRLVKVAETTNVMEALSVRLALETANIPYSVNHQRMADLHWLGPMTPTTWWVRADWADAAREALAKRFEVAVEQLPDRCPACQAEVGRRLECPECGLSLA